MELWKGSGLWSSQTQKTLKSLIEEWWEHPSFSTVDSQTTIQLFLPFSDSGGKLTPGEHGNTPTVFLLLLCPNQKCMFSSSVVSQSKDFIQNDAKTYMDIIGASVLVYWYWATSKTRLRMSHKTRRWDVTNRTATGYRWQRGPCRTEGPSRVPATHTGSLKQLLQPVICPQDRRDLQEKYKMDTNQDKKFCSKCPRTESVWARGGDGENGRRKTNLLMQSSATLKCCWLSMWHSRKIVQCSCVTDMAVWSSAPLQLVRRTPFTAWHTWQVTSTHWGVLMKEQEQCKVFDDVEGFHCCSNHFWMLDNIFILQFHSIWSWVGVWGLKRLQEYQMMRRFWINWDFANLLKTNYNNCLLF